MGYTSLLTARNDVLAVQAAAVTALTITTTALNAGTATPATYGRCQSAMTEAQEGLRSILVELDGTDVQAQQVYSDAAVTIELWAWERAVRATLVALDGQMQSAQAVIVQLLAGVQQTYHTVRAGETLQSIAATYLGSWTEWPRISAANGLKAGPIAAGTVILIPQAV